MSTQQTKTGTSPADQQQPATPSAIEEFSSAMSNLGAAATDLKEGVVKVPGAVGGWISSTASSVYNSAASAASAYAGSVAEGVDVIKDGVVGGASYVASTATGAYNATVDGVKGAYDSAAITAKNYKNDLVTGAGILKEHAAAHLNESVVTPTVGAIQDVTGATELKQQVAALQKQLAEQQKTAAPAAAVPQPVAEFTTPTLAYDDIISSLTSDPIPSPQPSHLFKNSEIVKGGTPEVKELKELLNSTTGSKLALNEELDSATLDAIKEFQKEAGIKVDGIVGKDTKAALSKALSETTNKEIYAKL